MGVDLRLIVTKTRPDSFWDENKLELDRDYLLFELLKMVPSLECNGVSMYEYDEKGKLDWMHVTTDKYGAVLRYTTAREIGKFADYCPVSGWNSGVLKFFKQMPADVHVIFYWH